jgi:periplasmic protein TonB
MKKILTLLFLLITLKGISETNVPEQTPKDTIDESVFSKVDVEAYFPGSEQLWNRYVQKQLEINIEKISRDRKSVGSCEIQFIVGRDGSITNVEALTLKNSVLAKVLIKAIEEGPKWVPAYQNGRSVKAYRRQKFTFQLPK